MFYITISNGLLEGNHRKKMGSAIWEFMWLIDKITKIDDEGFGWVLGGKPINLKDIKGIHPVNVSKNLKKLEKENYITIKHTPYGMIIKVAKAKKSFNKIIKSQDDRELAKSLNPISENAKPRNENAKPNKTIQLDNTIDNNNIPKGMVKTQTSYGNEDINHLIELLKEKNHNLIDGSIRENRRYCWLLLNSLNYKEDAKKAVRGVEVLIEFAIKSKFHSKNATNFRYLYHHKAAIIADYKGSINEEKTKVVKNKYIKVIS